MYADTVQLKLGLSVETLTQMCWLAEWDKNRLELQVCLPTAPMQSLTADSDHAQVITNAIGCLSLPLCNHTWSWRIQDLSAWSKCLSLATMWLHVYILVSPLCLPYNNGAQAAVVQELSTLSWWSVTAYWSANCCRMFTFYKKQFFPHCTENVPNPDTKTKIHIEPWILCTVTPPITIIHPYSG